MSVVRFVTNPHHYGRPLLKRAPVFWFSNPHGT